MSLKNRLSTVEVTSLPNPERTLQPNHQYQNLQTLDRDPAPGQRCILKGLRCKKCRYPTNPLDRAGAHPLIAVQLLITQEATPDPSQDRE